MTAPSTASRCVYQLIGTGIALAVVHVWLTVRKTVSSLLDNFTRLRLGSPSITTTTILFLQCRPNSDAQHRLMLARKARTYRKQEILHEERLRWKEDTLQKIHSSVHRTSLSEAILVARIRPGRPETEESCSVLPEIHGNCLTLARRAGLSLENRS